MAHPEFEVGLAHQRAGQLELADAAYAQVPLGDAAHGQATFLRASIALVAGRFDAALRLFSRALELEPANAAYHAGLAEAYRRGGQSALAFDCFERALSLAPALPEVAFRFGVLLEELGESALAIALYEHVSSLQPTHPVFAQRLARARESGQTAGAEKLEKSRTSEDLRARAWLLLGAVQTQVGRLEQAVHAYRHASEHARGDIRALVRLGRALSVIGRSREAEESFLQALTIDAESIDALIGLADVLCDFGQIDRAIPVLRRAKRSLHSERLGSWLVASLASVAEYDDAAILVEARAWQHEYVQPAATPRAFANVRSGERRLRVGYVSPYFCTHVNESFVPPLLRHHNRHAFEVFLYSDVATPDAETEIVRGLGDHWRDTAGWETERFAECIRDDRIDLLVDLSMHTLRNRLLLFAQKPAPVQLCWLAYPGTTGLAAMDYRITDRHLDPPGTDLSVYAERSLFLPDSFWCYDPRQTPDVNPLPAWSKGTLTFGCLNNFRKINRAVLALWAEVLRETPRARLLLHAPRGDARSAVLTEFEQRGVGAERIAFADFRPRQDYLATHHQIDIALDPFPQAGGTTTLDALWMGVPVVTLRGKTIAGRSGASILTNLGMPEFVANTPSEYVQIATDLAADEARLADLRSSLRARMRASPLMDAPRFARNLEKLYRQAWLAYVGCRDDEARVAMEE